MQHDATSTLPQETGALIDHIIRNYHEMHRADLLSLVPLAERVAKVHADDPDLPLGLASALEALARDMEAHMSKEETILFPAMREGGGAGIEFPISVMRADHEEHAQTIALLRQLTQDFAPPEHACGSWRSLYSGMAMLLEELTMHIAVENNVLFPRFEPTV